MTILTRKKSFALVGISLLILASSCGTKKTSSAEEAWSKRDSVAYAFGKLNGDGFRQSLKQLPDDSLSRERIFDGFRVAFFEQKGDSLNLDQAKDLVRNYITELSTKTKEAYKSKNDSVLIKHKEQQGVKVTESGLQYRILRPAKGIRPTVQDTVVVHYKGKTIEGKEFDNSYKRNQPAVFSVLDVIPGWTEGLCLMNKGAKYEFYIPANLAYGERGAGKDIKPYATLIFEVELLDVKPYQEKASDKDKVVVLKGKKSKKISIKK